MLTDGLPFAANTAWASPSVGEEGHIAEKAKFPVLLTNWATSLKLRVHRLSQ